MNDLDRAIAALRRSQAALPDFCREFIKGELWFLIPYHPEIEGECMELKPGAPLPFAMLEDDKGPVVPLFTSETRVDEGLAKGKVPPNRYSAAAMPAIQVLEILGKAELRAVLNKSCSTGHITIPADLMRDLADGSALKPSGIGEQEHGEVKILDAADYPIHMIQPAFEFMRRHRNFRAAWIFSAASDKSDLSGKARWRMLILMDPRDDQILHDLSLAVQSARREHDTMELGLLNQTDAKYTENLFCRAAPFYIAADFIPPTGTRPQVQ